MAPDAIPRVGGWQLRAHCVQRRRREGIQPGVQRSETPESYLRKSVNPCQGVTETVQHHEVMSTEMTTTTK